VAKSEHENEKVSENDKNVNNNEKTHPPSSILKSFTNTIYKTTSTIKKVKWSMRIGGNLSSWRRRLCTNNCCTMLP
jgi:hypothetical protein